MSPCRLPSSGTGSVHTSWCCTATSGIGTPASAPTVGPHRPAQSSTRSHSTRPCAVSTAWIRPSGRVEPGDGHAAHEPGAGRFGAPRERLDDPHALARAVARHPVPAEHGGGVEQRRPLGALGRATAARSRRSPPSARTPAGVSARRCAPVWSRARARRRRTTPARRRRRACRTARRSPGRSGTSCASRSFGRPARGRATWSRRSQRADLDRSPVRRSRRGRPGGRRRTRRRCRRRRSLFGRGWAGQPRGR